VLSLTTRDEGLLAEVHLLSTGQTYLFPVEDDARGLDEFLRNLPSGTHYAREAEQILRQQSRSCVRSYERASLLLFRHVCCTCLSGRYRPKETMFGTETHPAIQVES